MNEDGRVEGKRERRERNKCLFKEAGSFKGANRGPALLKVPHQTNPVTPC